MTKFLKQLRKKNQISKDYLAKKIRVSRPTYNNIEAGKRDLKVEEAQKLAQFFGMSLEDFLSGKKIYQPDVKIEKKKKNVKAKKSNIRISVPQERAEKFKQTLLYILEKVGALPNIGEAVICKVLYFIDFDYYEKYEEQLIGATYIKNHHGPTPVAFQEIIKEMEKESLLAPVKGKYFQYEQKKYLPLKSADLSTLSAREKELIDYEITRFKNFNASKIREYSHKDIPWVSADDLKPINYESVFYRTPEYSVRDYENDI